MLTEASQADKSRGKKSDVRCQSVDAGNDTGETLHKK